MLWVIWIISVSALDIKINWEWSDREAAAVARAQRTNQQLNDAMRSLDDSQKYVRDIFIVLGEIETAGDLSQLTPLRERLAAMARTDSNQADRPPSMRKAGLALGEAFS